MNSIVSITIARTSTSRQKPKKLPDDTIMRFATLIQMIAGILLLLIADRGVGRAQQTTATASSASTSESVGQPGLMEQTRSVRLLETVAEFYDQMPTGVAVSASGRVFVNFPRWGDDVKFTVGEVRNGKAAAYPNQDMNTTPTTETNRPPA